jgi:hypothetical protein
MTNLVARSGHKIDARKSNEAHRCTKSSMRVRAPHQ